MNWGRRQDPDDARNPGAGTRHGWKRPEPEPKGAAGKILRQMAAERSDSRPTRRGR